MTAAKAHTSIAAERAAAEAEGIFVPTPEQMRLVRRHAALEAVVKRHKDEMEAIKATLKAEMDAEGADKLHLDGVNVAQWIPTTKRSVDIEAMRAAHPGIVAMFEQAQAQFAEKAENFTLAEHVKHHGFSVKIAR